MRPCTKCQEPVASTSKFCHACGAAVALSVCKSCGGDLPVGARFCPQCGEATTSAPAVKATPLEERRWVTVLFADLSGFTSVSERLDPEDARALVDNCMRELCAVVEAYGGAVDKLIGDCIMAVWGAPKAHPDDAERAVRAGLAMFHCPFEQARRLGDIALSIGINTGEAMYGRVGGDEHAFTVIGDTVNTAARLQSAAGRGTLLVGAETHAATRQVIAYETVEPIVAKGKAQRVEAFRALSVAAAASGRPGSPERFVGRDAEIRQLDDLWSRVRETRVPRLVTMTGDAGVGKSKLVARWLQTLSVGTILIGRSRPYGDSAYGAMAQLITSAADILSTDSTSAAQSKLEHLLTTLELHMDVRTGAALATLAGLDPGGHLARGDLFHAATRFFEALARQWPTVLVFEDAHWASPSLLRLLETVVMQAGDAMLLVVVVARPELGSVLTDFGVRVPEANELRLGPLDDASCVELVFTLSHELVGKLKPEDATRLVAAAAGHPLLLEELVRSHARGERAEARSLSGNLRSMIAARLDALTPEERNALLDAAVVGPTFWPGALLACGHTAERLDLVLASLSAQGLIGRAQTSRIDGDDEYVFGNQLVREVAYSTLSKSARKQTHKVIGQFIRQRGVDRTGEIAPLLAHHAEASGDADAAIDYLLLAGSRAANRGESEEARQAYTRALALVPDDDLAYRARLLLQRALVALNAADYEAARPDLEAAMPHLTSVDLLDASLARLWTGTFLLEPTPLGRLGAVALASARESHVVSASALADSLETMGRTHDFAELADVCERVLATWAAAEDSSEHVRYHAMASDYARLCGRLELALMRAEQAVTQARRLPHIEPLLVALIARGGARSSAGRHSEAVEDLLEATTIALELERTPRHAARATAMVATAYRELLDYGAAAAASANAYELASEAKFLPAAVHARIEGALVTLAQGDTATAVRHMAEAKRGFEQLSGVHRAALESPFFDAARVIDLVKPDAAFGG